MEVKEIFEVSSAMVASLGGGAVVVLGFSGWLGKVWASRLMAKETAKQGEELATLRKNTDKE